MARVPHSPPLPPLKYVVGIDIAKDTFVACLGHINAHQALHLSRKPAEFANDAAGFAACRRWVAAGTGRAELPLRYVVEATGSYYEELAYYLHDQQQAVSVSFEPDARALARLAHHQALLEEQITEIEAQVAELVAADPVLARKLGHLTSIPGVGMVTAATLVGETNGFALIENERQLASYAGLDVVQRQSGKLSRPTSISKRGNARIRTALYLPALSNLCYNAQQKAFYARLRTQSSNGKVGVIAVMRKLLLLIYSLWKNDAPYDPTRALPATQLPQQRVAPAPLGAEATQDEPRKALLQEAQR